MAEHFSRISSMLGSARDITIEAAASASSRFTEPALAKRPEDISKLLNSRSDRDVLSGMKSVISIVSRGEDAVNFFADVVKNVTLSNSRVKALVMIYIQKYAQNEPDTALLSINSIQKSLGDKSPKSRAASIITLAGIQIPEIASLLVLCIKRTSLDPLSEVRSATALAIGKSFKISDINKKQLATILVALLNDSSTDVVAASVKVFLSLKLQLISLLSAKAWAPIHTNYRSYVKMLGLLEEWACCSMIDLLLEYCRRFIPRPKIRTSDGLEIDLPGSISEYPANFDLESATVSFDPDIELFLDSLLMLTFNISDLVTVSATRALMLIATPKHVFDLNFHRNLVRISCSDSGSVERISALQLILKLAQTYPQGFLHDIRRFFIFTDEDPSISICKLQILLCLFTEGTANVVMAELQQSCKSSNKRVASEAVKAIGYCSQSSPKWTNRILRWCISELGRPSGSGVVTEFLSVIRFLLQQKLGISSEQGNENEQLVRTVFRLSKLLLDPEMNLDPDAKASILWIIGEFTEPAKNIFGPDVLRVSVKLLPQEADAVRYELLMLAAKSYVFEFQSTNTQDSTLAKIFNHIIHLCKYDNVISTRDKARMLETLFKDPSSLELATLFLQVPKTVPILSNGLFTTSSLLELFLECVPWADPKDLPPKSIRKDVSHKELRFDGIGNADLLKIKVKKPFSSFAESKSGEKNHLQSLDEFFGNEEDESEESESEESESEESESEESEDDSDDSDDSDDEEEDSGEEDEEDSEEYDSYDEAALVQKS